MSIQPTKSYLLLAGDLRASFDRMGLPIALFFPDKFVSTYSYQLFWRDFISFDLA